MLTWVPGSSFVFDQLIHGTYRNLLVAVNFLISIDTYVVRLDHFDSLSNSFLKLLMMFTTSRVV